MILQKSTKQILKKITISARLESNGFDAIGLNSGTSTSSSPRSTQRKMLSRALGVIFSIEAFPPRTKLKPLRKNSILAWSVGHNLKKPTHHHCSGVATTISSTSRVPSSRGAEGPGLKSNPHDFLFSFAEALAYWKLRLKRLSSRHQSNDDGSAFSGCGPRTIQG